MCKEYSLVVQEDYTSFSFVIGVSVYVCVFQCLSVRVWQRAYVCL